MSGLSNISLNSGMGDLSSRRSTKRRDRESTTSGSDTKRQTIVNPKEHPKGQMGSSIFQRTVSWEYPSAFTSDKITEFMKGISKESSKDVNGARESMLAEITSQENLIAEIKKNFTSVKELLMKNGLDAKDFSMINEILQDIYQGRKSWPNSLYQASSSYYAVLNTIATLFTAKYSESKRKSCAKKLAELFQKLRSMPMPMYPQANLPPHSMAYEFIERVKEIFADSEITLENAQSDPCLKELIKIAEQDFQNSCGDIDFLCWLKRSNLSQYINP